MKSTCKAMMGLEKGLMMMDQFFSPSISTNNPNSQNQVKLILVITQS